MVVPRAETFDDLMTADHKVLSEGCESRHNHRYAVVVQDMATHGSQPAENEEEVEARNVFWSIEGEFIYRHHVEPPIHLHVPEEEPFTIPLNRTTHTNLDVMQEKRFKEYWNVDGDRTLSDSWTRFTKFTLLNEELLPGYVWSGERLTKIQATTRLVSLRPEIWFGMSKAPEKHEKQEWAVEKPRLDKARKLRGFYFIDPEDENFEETIENARKNIETRVEAANKSVLRSFGKLWRAETHTHKEHVCVVAAHEPTRKFGVYSFEKSRRSHRGQRIQLTDTLQFGA